MLILDTSHLTVLAKDDPSASGLRVRLARSGDDVGTTAVSVEEVLRGWLAKIAAQNTVMQQVRDDAKFQSSVEVLAALVNVIVHFRACRAVIEATKVKTTP